MEIKKNTKRKVISSILALGIMLTTMLSNVTPAEAATQNDAVAWANAQIGKGLDYDNAYGNQCVDLIKYYYNYFGVAGYAMGNANAYITNSLPPGWTRVYSGYQPGDVAVWKTNHSCNTCGTTSYGHVGIITSVNGSKFSAVNQNFNSKSYCTLNDFNISALACAIRPSYSSPVPPNPSVTFADYNQNGVWDTNAELYIKVMNPSKAHVSAVGCYLYDVNGTLVKSYSENISFDTSYVNYTCNFNSDMKYTLTAGTTYKVVLYAVVGGKEYKDTMRSFTTTDKTAPVISDVSVYDISETGYKVRCKATDNVGVVKVQFPTWTVFQGQDDIQSEWWENSKAAGTKDDSGYYVYEVRTSDHNGELGDYITHIYAFDQAGNKVGYAVPAVTLKKEVVETPQPTQVPEATKTPATAKPTTKPTTKATAKPTTKPNEKQIIEPDDEIDGERSVVDEKKPNKVTGLTVKSRSKKIYVSWRFTSSSKRTGYQIQYALNRSFSRSKKTTNLGYYTTSLTLKKLKKGKNYYVRVREFSRTAGKTVYGQWSVVKKVKVR